MAIKYTEEQLNTIDKSLLVQMFLNEQEQLELLTGEVRTLNEKMQLMMEQIILGNKKTFRTFFGTDDRCPSDSFHGSRWKHRIF